MELLLTPLIQSTLKRFIKSSVEGSGSDLKVTLNRGTITLHNLELNLEPLLSNFPLLRAKRAFARELKIYIPWTALTSQPIQVSSLLPAL